MKYQNLLQSVLLNDPMRMNALYPVPALELNDGWIGAGFVRDAVWDHLHGYGQRPVSGDVDVVWFDAKSATSACDSALEERLSWIGPYISRHFLSLNPLLVRRRRYSRGERYPSALCGCHSL